MREAITGLCERQDGAKEKTIRKASVLVQSFRVGLVMFTGK